VGFGVSVTTTAAAHQRCVVVTLEKTSMDDFVKIEYWVQDTVESGRFVQTPPMLRFTAEMILSRFDRGYIVELKEQP